MSISLRRIISWLPTVCIVVIVCGLAWNSAWAQQPAPAAPLPPQMDFERPLWKEIMITVVMIGVAVFVVCRNTNRN